MRAFRSPARVVLVEPQNSLNVGSVARVMMSYGFGELYLVAPRGYDQQKAGITGCWAAGILERATIRPNLPSALEGAEDVIAFSARTGKAFPRELSLEEWVAMPGTPTRRSALVFGPEDNGLRQEHLERCRLSVYIPTSPENPSLNLAQAALLVFYELSRARIQAQDPAAPRELARAEDYALLETMAEQLLDASGFYNRGTSELARGTVRSLMRRLDASDREMRIMLGCLSRIGKALVGPGFPGALKASAGEEEER